MNLKNFTPILTGLLIATGAGVLIAHAASTDYGALAPLPIGEGGDTLDTYTLSTYLSGIIKLLIALGAMMSIFVTILGGVQYVASGITPSAKQDAKNRITNALIGLTLILTSYLILNSINPELVNLKFELPAVSVAIPEEVAGACPSPNDSSVACCPSTLKCLTCSGCSEVTGVTNKGCGASVCFLNTTLLSKLKYISYDSGWRITESWPPTVDHVSACHQDGTCADINNTDGKTDLATIQKYYTLFQVAGLHVLYESNDCASYPGINCGKYSTMTNGSSFHVY